MVKSKILTRIRNKLKLRHNNQTINNNKEDLYKQQRDKAREQRDEARVQRDEFRNQINTLKERLNNLERLFTKTTPNAKKIKKLSDTPLIDIQQFSDFYDQILDEIPPSTDNDIERQNKITGKINRLFKTLTHGVVPIQQLQEDYNQLLLASLKNKHLPKDIVFNYNTLSQNKEVFNKATEALRKHGAIVLKSALENEKALATGLEFKKFVDNKHNKVIRGEFNETDQYAVDGINKISNYRDKAVYPKTFINVRGDEDYGLTDFFNIGYRFPTQEQVLNNTMKSPIIESLVNSVLMNAKFTNLNVYFNDSITKTRGFHVDSYEPKIKIFMYLTDVHTHDSGPYCYVLGSHNMKTLLTDNIDATRLTNLKKTDCSYAPSQEAHAFLTDAGDIVISFQNGMHRGYPQTKDHLRIMAVQSVDV